MEDLLSLPAADREILRTLAARVGEIAARPDQEEKRRLWYRHNALEATRPVIYCDPENGWHEIIAEKDLGCTGTLARQWEFRLRKEIFYGESMGDDKPVEPYFNVSRVSAESDWGMKETKIGGENGGAYVWESPLKDYQDRGKLRFPEITVDTDRTADLLDLAHDTVGDFLKVRLQGNWWWSLGLTNIATTLRGLEQILFDMYDYPDELHRLMAFLRDGQLHRLDFLESHELLSLNNDGTYVGSGGFGYTRELPAPDFSGRVRIRDLWGFCESQETVNVSPAMFQEFVFPYQLPILSRFGLNCYGCCEPLDQRWNTVKQTPNLRRVSVSPWANIAAMAEFLGARYIFSLKPNPADLAVPIMNQDYVRKNLREALRLTRHCRVEIIMKDNHTIGNNPQNITNWCRLTREEAEKV